MKILKTTILITIVILAVLVLAFAAFLISLLASKDSRATIWPPGSGKSIPGRLNAVPVEKQDQKSEWPLDVPFDCGCGRYCTEEEGGDPRAF